MKNKLMKVSLLLFLMALIAGKSLSQNQPVRIKAEHPRLILSSTDIELMRGNALSGIEPWKTAWKKSPFFRNRRGRVKPGMPVLRNYRSCVTR